MASEKGFRRWVARWYRAFRTQTALRVCLLGATLWLFSRLAAGFAYPTAAAVAAAALVYQLFALWRYVDRTNRDLARFFAAVQYDDFSQTFPARGPSPSFSELNASFNRVLEAFRRARATQEEQARYLQTLVQHIGVGLLVFDAAGRVSLVNPAAKRMLGVPRLDDIAALDRVGPGLSATVRDLGAQGRGLVRLGPVQLALRAAIFRQRERQYTLVSLHDIGGDLDEKEMEAWQDLIRVLTHEIMNSITPIASLAATAGDLLADDPTTKPDAETAADIRTAVDTIRRRSEGLLHFVEAYRDLTRLPTPDFSVFPVVELFDRVLRLLDTELGEAGIEARSTVEPPGLELSADPQQIEQVLINILSNAVQALHGQALSDKPLPNKPNGRIDLSARLERGNIVIEIADNGPGIVPEAIEKVFIPFFTTKQDGSGIGLSLCRQIMRLHGGSLAVRSEPQVQTVFALRF